MRLAHDVLWKSTATFVSDTNGIINISQTPSCSGSYEGISTMGLFFNAKPLTNKRKKLPNSLSKIPLLDHFFCGNQNYARKYCHCRENFHKTLYEFAN